MIQLVFVWAFTVDEGLYLQCRPPCVAVVAVCSLSVSLWEERCDFPTSAPTMYFYIPAYVWLASPKFRIPKSSQIGITFKNRADATISTF